MKKRYVPSYRLLSPGVQSDPEGTLWRDPPHYWEDVVYPAYLDAYKDAFVDGDVEHGQPTDKIEGLILLEGLDISMSEAVELCCGMLKDVGKTIDFA